MDCTLQSLWNNRDLPPPPVISIPVPFVENDKVKAVLKVLKEMQKDKERQDVITEENFTLCRIIYKLNAQLRSEKTLQILKRIKVCLSKLTKMKMQKTIEDYLHMLQQSNVMSRVHYLPSRQMIEYLLVRLMGARFLYRKTASFCSTAYVHLKQQLTIGTLVPQNLTLMALNSRIWVLMKVCAQCCVNWYNRIHTCLVTFPATTTNWLPHDTVLLSTIAGLEDENESSVISLDMVNRMEDYRSGRIRILNSDAVAKCEAETENSIRNTENSTSLNDMEEVLSQPAKEENAGKGRGWSEVHRGVFSSKLDSIEDEGITVSRSDQSHLRISHLPSSSEDEGEPILRSQLTDMSHLPVSESCDNEGQPISRGDLQGLHQSKKRKLVNDDVKLLSNFDASVASFKEFGNSSKPRIFLEDSVIQKSSIEQLIQMLNDMAVTNTEEVQLVKSYMKPLMKLKRGFTGSKKGLKKNLKHARKLVLNLKLELAQLGANHHTQSMKKKVKK